MHDLEDLKAGRLRGITRLDLNQGLEHFPPEIFTLADSLEVLNLSGNALHSLPDELRRLTRLKVLFCSDNRFTHVPRGVGRCPNLETVGFRNNRITELDAQALPPKLRALILTQNHLESLPEGLGDCLALEKLMLSGNRLTHLPASLARCHRLELLRIASNRLSHLPDWLLQMPALAWLAFSGNPLATLEPCGRVTSSCPSIDWKEIELGQELGRGASGIIHLAHWKAQPLPVAIKVFKGAITSDGSPLAEMDACIAAGEHPALVGMIGRIDNHPQGLPALVMPRIAPHWSNLAGPPSLGSCTRDQYRPGRWLTSVAMRRLAASIASVCAHLHAQGICHGDLYAHNVLCDAEGNALLGDFGAAAFYPAQDSQAGVALERLEVRAFGILLQELLQHCPDEDPLVLALARRCMQPQAAIRPGFAELAASLAA